MADRSAIEWTDATWNPLRARNRATGGVGHFCEHVSEACRNCYSERDQRRFRNPVRFARQDRDKVELFLDEDVLTQPLRWRRARMIFPCSMTDFLGEWVDDLDVARIVGLAIASHHLNGHVFQFLTKRAARLRALLGGEAFWEMAKAFASGEIMERVDPLARRSDDARATCGDYDAKNPPPGLWFGVSVEDQATADERVPDLLATPAAVRFVSYEPALGPVDFSPYLRVAKRSGRPWSDFAWPAWVPDKVRREVEDFWRQEWGRGPSEWLRSAIENGHPALGARGAFSLLQSRAPKIEGRFIHAWNNIGRVVDDAGASHCVSAGRWQVPNPYLDLIISGGESGPHARAAPRSLFRSVRDQCASAGAAYFHKQNGEWIDADEWHAHLAAYGFEFVVDSRFPRSPLNYEHAAALADVNGDPYEHFSDGSTMIRVGKKRAGRLLDGATHDALPRRPSLDPAWTISA